MSISLMTLAWKTSLPSIQKMVLLALCDNANDQGECYPSIQMLVSKCSLSVRAIQKQLNELEVAGIIRREMRNGRSTVYWIDPRTLFTPEQYSPPHVVHPTPAHRAPPPPHVVHPTPAHRAPITINEPSIEPSVNQKNIKKGASGSFDPLAYLLSLGVARSIAADWLDHRKSKKAAPSKTAIDVLVREAEKGAFQLDDVLAESCQRGWVGFKAEWLAPKMPAQASTAQPFANRRPTIEEQRAIENERARQMIFGNRPQHSEVIDA